MFRAEFPRVYELFDLIDDRANPNAYGQNFESSIRKETSKRRFWKAREKELQLLDQRSWDFLKNEVVSYLTARDQRGRGWEQLFNILNQARAHNYLRDISCVDVTFIPPKSKDRVKRPDLEAIMDSNIVICEVKTINVSEQQAEAKQFGLVSETLPYLEPGFFRKLDNNLEKAKGQMQSYCDDAGAKHICFMVINFDDLFGEYKNNYYEQIDKYLAEHHLGETEIVFFNQRTCFHEDVYMNNAKVVNEIS